MVMAARDKPAQFRPDSAAELIAGLSLSSERARLGLAAVADGRSLYPDRYVADLVHFLAILHGELPSVFDTISIAAPELEDVLEPAAQQMHRDRAWIADLSVDAGSAVDLTGLTEAEISVRGLRDAMLTLATSRRRGCGLGVSLSLLSDWPSLRQQLDSAGALAFSARWPEPAGRWRREWLTRLVELAEDAFESRSIGRAVAFGASQYGQVHGQLLAIADARAAAR